MWYGDGHGIHSTLQSQTTPPRTYSLSRRPVGLSVLSFSDLNTAIECLVAHLVRVLQKFATSSKYHIACLTSLSGIYVVARVVCPHLGIFTLGQ